MRRRRAQNGGQHQAVLPAKGEREGGCSNERVCSRFVCPISPMHLMYVWMHVVSCFAPFGTAATHIPSAHTPAIWWRFGI